MTDERRRALEGCILELERTRKEMGWGVERWIQFLRAHSDTYYRARRGELVLSLPDMLLRCLAFMKRDVQPYLPMITDALPPHPDAGKTLTPVVEDDFATVKEDMSVERPGSGDVTPAEVIGEILQRPAENSQESLDKGPLF